MTLSPPSPELARDAVTVQMLRGRDPDGLRRLLADHGGRIRGALRREFKSLSAEDIEDALSAASLSLWRAAASFDPIRGSLRAWFYVSVRNAVLGILRREQRERRKLDARREELAAAGGVLGAGPDPAFVADLHSCIGKLTGLQRAIIEADLVAPDGTAPAAELAARHDSSKNSIYVSRSAARKALKHCLEGHGHAFGEGKERNCDE